MTRACSVRVRGVVQGVGFRPFVYRLARANTLAGWVRNGEDGVLIHVEGSAEALDAFLQDLHAHPPAAARITGIDVQPGVPRGLREFLIGESDRQRRPTVPVGADLPVCADCLAELFDPGDERFHYPYINCTNCGPRYTVVTDLPYDRANTTMRSWALDARCAAEYHEPRNRRFHAQPVACPECGPGYHFVEAEDVVRGGAAIGRSVEALQQGRIVAVKGIGGFHLACDARHAAAVSALRARKFRKEQPFAVMVRDLEAARAVVALSADAEALLTAAARPIVLAPARVDLPGVAPGYDELGVMLPYAPVHHLLFAAGAPDVLVMTSGNRSSEPIAYEDDDARARLAGLADAWLTGERPIARRVDDSVARAGALGPVVLRRSRGYAPAAVASLPTDTPLLAVGGDLKNTVTLVVAGQAFVSQHIGDLDDARSRRAYGETIRDLLRMYGVTAAELTVVHDAHPQFVSTEQAHALSPRATLAAQHHRAHVASVLAERQAWDTRVVGVSFDGTGYGDDGAIWGGEIFVGSLLEGFERVAHLRPATLAGGDAAARHPVQAAAGFLLPLEARPDFAAPPFSFPPRFRDAAELLRRGVRTWPTTSAGRLFDTAAALLGFTRAVTFEGQAAIWLEQLARRAPRVEPYPFPFDGVELDFRPLLAALIDDRLRGREVAPCARAFHAGLAHGLAHAVTRIAQPFDLATVVLSGGVFQNDLLLRDLRDVLSLRPGGRLWVNQQVPPNDGGLSLGQAALGCFSLLADSTAPAGR